MVLGAGATSVGGAASADGAGVTVVTVSGVNGPVGSGAGAGGGAGADIDGVRGGAFVVAAAGVEVAAGGLTVVETEPLSPPPRRTTVQITATSRIAPATPATHIHRRSRGSTYS